MVRADTLVYPQESGVPPGPDGRLLMPSPRPFRLGGLTSDDLVDRWLVIEHEIVLNRPFYLAPPNHPDTDEAPSVYREYTHLSHEVFSELLRPKPWER